MKKIALTQLSKVTQPCIHTFRSISLFIKKKIIIAGLWNVINARLFSII